MQDSLFGFTLVILIVVFALIVVLIYLFQQLREAQNKAENAIKNYEAQLRDIQVKHKQEIEKARKQSVDISRHTIKGQIAEQLAPILAGFPYLPSDSHFIGDPIDYIIFNGYTDFKDRHVISDNFELVIVDIKHNKAQLSEGQKQIAKAIEAGKVRFETIRISDDGNVEINHQVSANKKEALPLPADIPVVQPNSDIQPSEKPNSAFRNWYAFLRKFPNAYEPWSESDDNLLKEKYMAGTEINELAILLQRNPGKIRSRLKEKGLIKKK
jgi:predicted Holliday junction resolvase-like endonuclease